MPTAPTHQLIIQDEGTDVANTPHVRLNFVGAGITAADGGSDTADVTVDAGGRTESTVQTVGNTPTTLATIAITDNTTVMIEAAITARRSDVADNRAGYIRRAVVYRAGGVATLLGSVDTPMTRELQGNWNATIIVSGNNAVIQVTGGAGQTIEWKSCHLTCVSP